MGDLSLAPKPADLTTMTVHRLKITWSWFSTLPSSSKIRGYALYICIRMRVHSSRPDKLGARNPSQLGSISQVEWVPFLQEPSSSSWPRFSNLVGRSKSPSCSLPGRALYPLFLSFYRVVCIRTRTNFVNIDRPGQFTWDSPTSMPSSRYCRLAMPRSDSTDEPRPTPTAESRRLDFRGSLWIPWFAVLAVVNGASARPYPRSFLWHKRKLDRWVLSINLRKQRLPGLELPNFNGGQEHRNSHCDTRRLLYSRVALRSIRQGLRIDGLIDLRDSNGHRLLLCTFALGLLLRTKLVHQSENLYSRVFSGGTSTLRVRSLSIFFE